MKILITGSKGFIGKNLYFNLKEKNKYKISEFNRNDSYKKLEKLVNTSDIIFHCAGENRAKIKKNYKISNVDLTKKIINILNKKKSKTYLIFTSTKLINYKDKSTYSITKFKAEEIIRLKLKKKHKFKILRLPNIFGKWAKPNYNSVVATFCYNISRNIPISILKNKNIDFCYIDDLLKLFNAIIINKYKKISIKTYKCNIKTLAEKIKKLKKDRFNSLKNFSKSKFDKYLYATYLTYIPIKDITYKLISNSDYRGDFVELFKYPNNGQISYFSIKPKVKRGEHYHNTKVEKFFLVDGKVIFDFYDLNTKKKFSIKLDSKDNKILETIPGIVHSIRNMEKKISKGIIWSNEVFDKNNPDTINA